MSAARPRTTSDGVGRAGERGVGGDGDEARVDEVGRLAEGGTVEVDEPHELGAEGVG